jgi:hypothetical protein
MSLLKRSFALMQPDYLRKTLTERERELDFLSVIAISLYSLHYSIIHIPIIIIMEFCLSTLGCELPVAVAVVGGRRRRQLALSEALQPQRRVHVRKAKNKQSSCHGDSFLVYGSYNVVDDTTTAKKQDDDDDTASTLSTLSSTEEDDSLGFSKTISFAEPLVTSVRTRPSTTKEDKYYLYYNAHDYMDFKIESLTGRERCRRVSFAREVVSEVHTVVPLTNPHEALYYSESELQQ